VGGLGDVVTSLSRAMIDEGHEVEVILPKYDVMKWGEVEGLKKVRCRGIGLCCKHALHLSTNWIGA
jgi:starch synthase